MENETAIEPVASTDVDANGQSFGTEVGKVFVVGAALGAGLYAGRFLVEWTRDTYRSIRQKRAATKLVSVPTEGN